MSVRTISPKQLQERIQAGESIEIIDVRTPMEFQEVHAVTARNEPLESLDCRRVLAGRTAGVALYVICRSGGRGRQACEKLMAAGCTDVVNVEGGTVAWDQAGLPVRRGRKVISLERQVRIAAGLLVLTGAVLALTVHPWWAGLSAFVGAGLMFAGITDTCGMALMLARMPWNQISPANSASCSMPKPASG
ncbi:MAG: rhodanese-like domain-containing protein [Planctomycetota bacterium]